MILCYGFPTVQKWSHKYYSQKLENIIVQWALCFIKNKIHLTNDFFSQPWKLSGAKIFGKINCRRGKLFSGDTLPIQLIMMLPTTSDLFEVAWQLAVINGQRLWAKVFIYYYISTELELNHSRAKPQSHSYSKID